MTSPAVGVTHERFYRSVRAIVWGLSRVLFRIEVRGTEHLPAQRQVIYAATHRSALDTPFLGGAVKDPVRFLAKDSIFKSRIGNWCFPRLGAIPVERATGGPRALRLCLEALAQGDSIAIFPEGTRKNGPTVEALHDGCAYLALKAGVPIVPIGIGGSERLISRGRRFPWFVKVVVVVGPLIEPPSGNARTSAPALTRDLQIALQALFDEAQGE